MTESCQDCAFGRCDRHFPVYDEVCLHRSDCAKHGDDNYDSTPWKACDCGAAPAQRARRSEVDKNIYAMAATWLDHDYIAVDRSDRGDAAWDLADEIQRTIENWCIDAEADGRIRLFR